MGADIFFHLEEKVGRRWQTVEPPEGGWHRFRSMEAINELHRIGLSTRPRGLSEAGGTFYDIAKGRKLHPEWSSLESVLGLRLPSWFGAYLLGPMVTAVPHNKARLLWYITC